MRESEERAEDLDLRSRRENARAIALPGGIKDPLIARNIHTILEQPGSNAGQEISHKGQVL